MYYCNEIYSLSVLSLYEGELLGTVDKLYFDKKLKKLCELELVSDNGAKLILPSKSIYHLGKNAITVKNNQAVSLKIEENPMLSCPIGSKAYSITGEYLGSVNLISLNDKFEVEKLSLDNDTILDINNLATCGKNTLIFNDSNNKIDTKKFVPQKTPKFFKSEKVQSASIMPEEEKNQNIEEIKPEPNQPQSQAVKMDEILLGRVCTKDIYNFNNELIIKAHSIVNKKNLKDIKKYGKIRELMLYSK